MFDKIESAHLSKSRPSKQKKTQEDANTQEQTANQDESLANPKKKQKTQ